MVPAVKAPPPPIQATVPLPVMTEFWILRVPPVVCRPPPLIAVQSEIVLEAKMFRIELVALIAPPLPKVDRRAVRVEPLIVSLELVRTIAGIVVLRRIAP
ncbi:Hypothetical protein MVR_LOCUS180 [uncultured virus]|nr:Hypothetical protein MVR_LOCUS180 [uncultured virus]